MRADSTMSKKGYLLAHILMGLGMGVDAYFYPPQMVSSNHMAQWMVAWTVCMVGTSALGIARTYQNSRNERNWILNICSGMGLCTMLYIGRQCMWTTSLIVSAACGATVIGLTMVINRSGQPLLGKLHRSMRLIGRNAQIAVAIALVALPASLLLDRVNILDQNMSDLTIEQSYGDEYCMAANIDTIQYIRDNDAFESLDYEERCEVLEAILGCVGNYLGLSEFQIIFDEELAETIRGQYDYAERSIAINADVIRGGMRNGGSAEELLKTCLEECRHYYQHLVAELYLSATPEQRNLLMFTEPGVADWIENFKDYHRVVEDDLKSHIAYLTQPLEVDAKHFAEREALAFYAEIDRLLEEQRE